MLPHCLDKPGQAWRINNVIDLDAVLVENSVKPACDSVSVRCHCLKRFANRQLGSKSSHMLTTLYAARTSGSRSAAAMSRFAASMGKDLRP